MNSFERPQQGNQAEDGDNKEKISNKVLGAVIYEVWFASHRPRTFDAMKSRISEVAEKKGVSAEALEAAVMDEIGDAMGNRADDWEDGDDEE